MESKLIGKKKQQQKEMYLCKAYSYYIDNIGQQLSFFIHSSFSLSLILALLGIFTVFTNNLHYLHQKIYYQYIYVYCMYACVCITYINIARMYTLSINSVQFSRVCVCICSSFSFITFLMISATFFLFRLFSFHFPIIQSFSLFTNHSVSFCFRGSGVGCTKCIHCSTAQVNKSIIFDI